MKTYIATLEINTLDQATKDMLKKSLSIVGYLLIVTAVKVSDVQEKMSEQEIAEMEAEQKTAEMEAKRVKIISEAARIIATLNSNEIPFRVMYENYQIHFEIDRSHTSRAQLKMLFYDYIDWHYNDNALVYEKTLSALE